MKRNACLAGEEISLGSMQDVQALDLDQLRWYVRIDGASVAVPMYAEISIDEIAHNLALLQRWDGHGRMRAKVAHGHADTRWVELVEIRDARQEENASERADPVVAPHGGESPPPAARMDPAAPDEKNFFSIKRLRRATRNSFDGLVDVYRSEASFRLELVIAAVLIPIALFVPGTAVQTALLLVPILLVLAVELLNSGIEAAIDRMSLERDPLAKKAKDAGSAAVFVTAVVCIIAWGLVLSDIYG